MNTEEQIPNAEKWVKESKRAVAYGVCVLVGGTISLVLEHHYDLPTKIQIVTGVIFVLIGTGMITESNFYAARRHLQDLQNQGETK